MRAIHHGRVNFDTAVDRARVHHDGIRFGQLQLFGREAEAFEILLTRREQGAAHAFVLQTQGDHHIAIFDAFFQVMKHLHTHLRHVGWDQSLRAHHANFGAAQGGERMNVGARHARVQHVTHNGHREVGEIFFVVTYGVHVQQTLRGVCVSAVTSIDHVHMRCHVLCNEVGRARLGVANHKNIGRHGRQIGDGVEQGFTFGC